jgi:ribosomal protein S18 acetylase RimI-like enzyme
MKAKRMLIRRLVPADALAFQAMRLDALRESPSAFGASYEEECDTPLATIEARLAPDSGRLLFGAFDGSALGAIVGVAREQARKARHKAFIRAMYVAPALRGRGVGRQLFEHALAFAASIDGVRQVTLSLTAGNTAALDLYASLGFKVCGQEPDALCVDGIYYDDIHMVRML